MKNKEFEKMKHREAKELQKEVGERQEKLWQAKKEIANGKEKDVRKAKKLRQEIAQLQTLLSSKRIEEKDIK